MSFYGPGKETLEEITSVEAWSRPTCFWKLTFYCLDLPFYDLLERLRLGLLDTCKDLIYMGDGLSGIPEWERRMKVKEREPNQRDQWERRRACRVSLWNSAD